jgi:exodeoxyribonuclease V alpha subunit
LDPTNQKSLKHISLVTAGEWLAAEGWWVRDREHGLQFKAATMKTVPPTTAEGIERYPGSGLVLSAWTD